MSRNRTPNKLQIPVFINLYHINILYCYTFDTESSSHFFPPDYPSRVCVGTNRTRWPMPCRPMGLCATLKIPSLHHTCKSLPLSHSNHIHLFDISEYIYRSEERRV